MSHLGNFFRKSINTKNLTKLTVVVYKFFDYLTMVIPT